MLLLFRGSYQSLRADREREQTKYEVDIRTMDEDHTTELQDIGTCIIGSQSSCFRGATYIYVPLYRGFKQQEADDRV